MCRDIETNYHIYTLTQTTFSISNYQDHGIPWNHYKRWPYKNGYHTLKQTDIPQISRTNNIIKLADWISFCMDVNSFLG